MERRTATEVGMRMHEAFESIRSWRELRDKMFRDYINKYWTIGVDMANEKKKPLTMQGLKDSQDTQARYLTDRLNAQLRKNVELEQSMGRMCDRLSAVERANQSLEAGFSKLIQQHCNHDYEIVGGCISNTNRLNAGMVWSGIRVKPRTIKVRCVHCGYTVDQPLDAVEEPAETPKQTVWQRFNLYFRFKHDKA